MKNESKLSIKHDGMVLFSDAEKCHVKLDGKEIAGLKSMKIDYNLEEAVTVQLNLIDFGLDLSNVPYEIKMDEIFARLLLMRIIELYESNASNDQFFEEMGAHVGEAIEMTRGLEAIETVDVTTAGSCGYRQTVNVKKK